jgi:signal peptidase II
MTIRHTLTHLWRPALIALVVIAVDQATKALVVRTWPVPQSGQISLLGSWLVLTYIRNSGIAFGLFQGIPQVFTLTSIIIVSGMTYYYLRHVPQDNRLHLVTFGLIVGGALGNVIDRIRLGYVVDWIQTFAGRFPLFNLADSAVVVGVALFAAYTFVSDSHADRT